MKNRRRLETLSRVIYESFTPAMMRRTPMWLKRRIAAQLGYTLDAKITVDGFMQRLFTAKPDQLVSMPMTMFDSSVGGYSVRPFFRLSFLWRMARRVWRGQTHTAKQREALGKARKTGDVVFPGFPPVNEIPHRRRLP